MNTSMVFALIALILSVAALANSIWDAVQGRKHRARRHKKCKGYLCHKVSYDGTHSPECLLEHLAAQYNHKIGEHSEARYSGYTDQTLTKSWTDVEKAAWWNGICAQEPVGPKCISPLSAANV